MLIPKKLLAMAIAAGVGEDEATRTEESVV